MTAIIFDVETTSLVNPEIIEAAWIAIDTFDAIPQMNALTTPASCQRYKPDGAISFGAMATHHIFPEDLEDCQPSSAFALPPGTQYLIGHNVDFDHGAAGSPDVQRICTDAISRHTWQDADSYSLVALVYRLSGKSMRGLAKGAHGAVTDCWLAVVLLQHILARASRDHVLGTAVAAVGTQPRAAGHPLRSTQGHGPDGSGSQLHPMVPAPGLAQPVFAAGTRSRAAQPEDILKGTGHVQTHQARRRRH